MCNLRPMPSSMLACDYGGLRLMKQYDNVDHVTRFLRGLLDSYSLI